MGKRLLNVINILLILYFSMPIFFRPALLLGGLTATFFLLYPMTDMPDGRQYLNFIYSSPRVLQYSMLGISIFGLFLMHGDVARAMDGFISEKVLRDVIETTYLALYAFAGSLYVALKIGEAAGSMRGRIK